MSLLSKLNTVFERIGQEFRYYIIPIGTVLPFAGNAVPTKYFLLCNGSAVSRITYAKLFNVIGTMYGEGDGSETFNLPNFIDRTIWGGNSSTVGTVKAAGLPNITGSLTTGTNVDTEWGGEWYSGSVTKKGALSCTSRTTNKAISGANWSGGQNLASLTFDASKSNAIYGKSTTVQPPALTMMMLIRY